MNLNDRVAIVTGASSGIGAALARQLSAAGVRVVLAARTADKLQALAAELAPAQALVVPTDVKDPAQVEHLVARTVEHFGGVDILVNNAGFGLYGLVEEYQWDHLRELWEVNFFAVVHLTQAALPHLRARRGAVVNISSVAGKVVLPYMTGYCASKFALNAFSDGLRMELARAGVRVITVCPGRVRTDFHRLAYRDGKNLPEVFQRRGDQGVPAESVARATVLALRRNRREIIVPAKLYLVTGLRRLFPALTDRLVARVVR